MKILVFLTLIISGCASWGYRGPLYNWTKEDIIYYDINRSSICFKESSKKIFYVSVLWDKNNYFEKKDISEGSNCYEIPDSISQKIKDHRSKINVFSGDGMTSYTITISKPDWYKKNYIYGYPINDISNYREMNDELQKLDKETN